MDEGKPQARAALGLIGNKFTVDWSEYLGPHWSEPVKTAVDMGRLRALGKAITSYPSDWVLHPRVLAIMQARERMLSGDIALDWGAAENLAYATLVQDGYPIRLWRNGIEVKPESLKKELKELGGKQDVGLDVSSHARNFFDCIKKGGQPAANTGEVVQQALNKALVDMQELADTAYRAQADSVAVVTKRVAEHVEELKTLLQPKK